MKKLILILVLIVALVWSASANAEITFVNGRHQASIRITKEVSPTECEEERPVAAKVTVKDPFSHWFKGKRVLWTPNICESHNWHLPYVRFLRVEPWINNGWRHRGSGSELAFTVAYCGYPGDIYKVIVESGGEREVKELEFIEICRGDHIEKIWEGTDAFINYCIDKGKEIRSSRGHLYCIRKVSGARSTNRVRWIG